MVETQRSASKSRRQRRRLFPRSGAVVSRFSQPQVNVQPQVTGWRLNRHGWVHNKRFEFAEGGIEDLQKGSDLQVRYRLRKFGSDDGGHNNGAGACILARC